MSEHPPILHPAALAWASDYYQTDLVLVTITREEDDDPDRFLALIAAANQPGWQAAELWLENGVVVAINDLGEGRSSRRRPLALVGRIWPFSGHAA